MLAGNADEVTAAITARLGLSYEHFTKCVVLPQGEFARFLHDKPAARQDLLVSLLDLGVYERMAALAGERASAAKSGISVLEGRLHDVSMATPEAVAAAAARVEQLSGLVAALDAAMPEIAALDDEVGAIATDIERVAADVALLSAVAVPRGLAKLHDRLTASVVALERAGVEVTAAEAACAASELALTQLGDRATLVRWSDAHDRGAGLRERRVKGEVVVSERRADAAAAIEVVAVATSALDAAPRGRGGDGGGAPRARGACRSRRWCRLPGLPAACRDRSARESTGGNGQDKVGAREGRARGQSGQRGAGRSRQGARGRAESALANLDVELADVDQLLAGSPEPDEVRRLLAAHTKVSADVEAHRAALVDARAKHAAALADRETLSGEEADARAAYDDARDSLAPLKPPSRRGRSAAVLDEWTALVEWAALEAESRSASVRELEHAARTVAERREARMADLASRCVAAELEVLIGREPSSVHVKHSAVRARTTTRSWLGPRLRRRLRAELVEVERQRELAHGLALHLNANHFEKWLLDEAMTALADGATDLLRTLSGDQYSLRVDAKNGSFVVVDHRNADEVRSARTLSGGETFLASLALALALADRIAMLAARGSARLESIFLDEGFGSLDPDTLDVVASAIEELGATGRLVGVVSHVAELAERLPVRYEVRRAGNASTVERIDR